MNTISISKRVENKIVHGWLPNPIYHRKGVATSLATFVCCYTHTKVPEVSKNCIRLALLVGGLGAKRCCAVINLLDSLPQLAD